MMIGAKFSLVPCKIPYMALKLKVMDQPEENGLDLVIENVHIDADVKDPGVAKESTVNGVGREIVTVREKGKEIGTMLIAMPEIDPEVVTGNVNGIIVNAAEKTVLPVKL